MPRLTNAQYLYQRHRLRVSWQHRKAEPFTALNPNEQLRLYAYFAPTLDLSDAEAVAHRKLVTERFSALPQQAGRAYVRVVPYLDVERSGPVIPERRTTRPRGVIRINATRRHEVDIQKLARALVNLIREDQDDRVA